MLYQYKHNEYEFVTINIATVILEHGFDVSKQLPSCFVLQWHSNYLFNDIIHLQIYLPVCTSINIIT